jgi:hypothetical protein
VPKFLQIKNQDLVHTYHQDKQTKQKDKEKDKEIDKEKDNKKNIRQVLMIVHNRIKNKNNNNRIILKLTNHRIIRNNKIKLTHLLIY